MGFWEGPRALQGPIASRSGQRLPLEGPKPLAPRNWWTLEKPLAPLLKGHWPLPRPERPGGGASNIQHHTTSYNIHTTSHTTSYNIGPFDYFLIVSRL